MLKSQSAPTGGLKLLVQDLDPGYFALVMATGIVSIAFYLLGIPQIAWGLFAINLVAFIVLMFLSFSRMVLQPHRMWGDLNDHLRSPGFFTTIAGMCILGNQFIIIFQNAIAGVILWIISAILWLGLIYTFFTLMITKENKPNLENGVNGGWLIVIVSTQALSTLATLALPRFLIPPDIGLFTALILYLIGDMFYIFIMELIFYRLLFFNALSQQIAPPYWINLGAAAITTLAGSTLILNASKWSLLNDLLPFLKGFTLFFWAFATWWLPLLFLLGLWRHLVKKLPLVYDPLYWRLVFPLGVYTVATLQLSKATGLNFLMVIPYLVIFAAAIAWLLTFIGMLAKMRTSRRNNAQGGKSDGNTSSNTMLPSVSSSPKSH